MDLNLNNANQLPFGFGYRFHPTPSEVLQHYLVPKMRGEGLPSDYITDLDVYGFDPDNVPFNQSMYARDGHESYFFVPVTRELLQDEHNSTRVTPNGYWKIFEHNVQLYGRDGANIGYKNKLEFYDNGDVKTNWKMVEYRTNYPVDGDVENFMVCKLRLKEEEEEIIEEEHGEVDN